MLERLIPASLRHEGVNVDELRRIRLLTWMNLSFIVLSFCAFPIFWEHPLTHPVWVTPFVVLATCSSSFAMLWAKKDWRLAAKTTCLGILVLAGPVLYPLGGLYSRTAYWACFAAPVAMFLLGRRWGLICAALVWLEFAVLFVMHATGVPIPDAQVPPAVGMGVILTLFMTAMFVVAWAFETSREQAEAALVKSMKLQQELEVAKTTAELAHKTHTAFMATISHELRTPLSTIIGYSELLLEETEHDPALEPYSNEFNVIQGAGGSLLGLVDDILLLLALDTGDTKPTLESVEVSGVVTRLAERFRSRAAKKGNVLELEDGGDGASIETDSECLSLCLTRLLDNACKFTSDGRITLRVVEDDARVHIEVEDTGIGIAPELHDTIFERFAQADGSTSRAYDGSGLGLAIVREMVEAIGGRVSLESEPGRGSLFRLSFPRA